MQGLSTRIGAEGFFCLVRSSSLYNTAPKWYYTRKSMDDYLKFIVRSRWDPRLVGTQLEAFAMAGCDLNCGFIYSARILTLFLTLYPKLRSRKSQLRLTSRLSEFATYYRIGSVSILPTIITRYHC